MNDSENIPYQNLWDATTEVLRDQLTALNHALERREGWKSMGYAFSSRSKSTREVIIKIREEIDVIENKRMREKFKTRESWFFKRLIMF